jgi:hypothetical protein
MIRDCTVPLSFTYRIFTINRFFNQLRSHAQDATTALALSLTPNIDDPAMVELMVSSIFDSGYYASIRVVDLATDKPLVERSGIPEVGNALAPSLILSGFCGEGASSLATETHTQEV